MSKFIAHSRTPGSKNGVRRYQYEDGTWTPEGLERRRAEYAKFNRSNENGMRALVGTTGTALAATNAILGVATAKKDYNKMASSINNSKDIMSKTRDAAEVFEKKRLKPNTQDLSSDELREMVKRMELEKKYAELLDYNRDKGKDWVSKAMGAVGGVLAIGVPIVTIIAAIHGMKKAKE